MLHHLPRKLREQGAREMRRVLKPGGRVLVVDFGGLISKRVVLRAFISATATSSLRKSSLCSMRAGLNVFESGAAGIKDLHFALATSPCSKP